MCILHVHLQQHTESREYFSLCSMATANLSKGVNDYVVFANVFATICGFSHFSWTTLVFDSKTCACDELIHVVRHLYLMVNST